MKPAELTPLCALRIAELMAEVGLPPGVVNIVPGPGRRGRRAPGAPPGRPQDRVHRLHRGRAPDRRAVGRQPQARPAGARRQGRQHRVRRRRPRGRRQRLRVRDLPQPGPGLHRRLAAHPPRVDRRRLPRPLHRAGRVDPPRRPARPGDRDGTAHLGRPSRPRARATSRSPGRGRRGAHRRHGPGRPGPAAGFYVRPTVVRADPASTRLPRGGLRAVRDGHDVPHRRGGGLAIANGVDYGLGGGLWTRDLSRAHRVARAIRAGWSGSTATSASTPGSPFGGTGLSGYGREMGFEAMHEYTEPKSVWVNVDADLRRSTRGPG